MFLWNLKLSLYVSEKTLLFNEIKSAILIKAHYVFLMGMALS
ncbi:hypothetical protein CSC17_4476 [Klebsiella oxytoca]|nr:hypothetical protein CSC17_4476 [Klebsiella oxytoca]